jgi:transcriptional regulator with XRE-family HTH domain
MANGVLADFLRTRRARIDPRSLGTTGEETRRVPGLRREEIAELAGISTSWYTLLEQGQRTDVSVDALRAIAQALRLNSHETVYLFAVAKETIPTDCLRDLGGDVGHGEAFERVAKLDNLLCYDDAGLILDASAGILALGNLGTRTAARGEPLYQRLFFHAGMRERYAAWETQADHAVAVLRYHCAGHRATPPWLSQMLALPSFRKRWLRHDVHSDIGWRPQNTVNVPGADAPIVLRSFGFMAPGGGRVIYYLGATDDDANRMRQVSEQTQHAFMDQSPAVRSPRR